MEVRGFIILNENNLQVMSFAHAANLMFSVYFWHM